MSGSTTYAIWDAHVWWTSNLRIQISAIRAKDRWFVVATTPSAAGPKHHHWGCASQDPLSATTCIWYHSVGWPILIFHFNQLSYSVTSHLSLFPCRGTGVVIREENYPNGYRYKLWCNSDQSQPHCIVTKECIKDTHIMHTHTQSEFMITAKALLGMIYGDFDCGYVCVVY